MHSLNICANEQLQSRYVTIQHPCADQSLDFPQPAPSWVQSWPPPEAQPARSPFGCSAWHPGCSPTITYLVFSFAIPRDYQSIDPSSQILGEIKDV